MTWYPPTSHHADIGTQKCSEYKKLQSRLALQQRQPKTSLILSWNSTSTKAAVAKVSSYWKWSRTNKRCHSRKSPAKTSTGLFRGAIFHAGYFSLSGTKQLGIYILSDDDYSLFSAMRREQLFFFFYTRTCLSLSFQAFEFNSIIWLQSFVQAE